MKDIKDYRDKELKYLLIANAILFVLCTKYLYQPQSFNVDKDSVTLIINIVSAAFISGAISLIAYIFDSIYSNRLKDILLGFGFIRKPGETIFTRIANNKIKDDRFTSTQVKERYLVILSELPSDIKERRHYENSQWYLIYSKHEESTKILVSQRDSLLCRDLYISTVTFLFFYLVGLLSGLASFSVGYLLYLIILSIVLNVATHIKASRFVNNVIAADVAATKIQASRPS